MKFKLRTRVLAMALIVAMMSLIPLMSNRTSARQEATPGATWSCAGITTQATPRVDHGGMDMGTPMAGDMPMHMAMDIDQMYIDMMIPHHASIIALARAALPELTDERLIAVAESIITAQTAEIEELQGYREDLFGDQTVMPMNDQLMGMMMQMMPGMGSMENMTFQMNAEAQVRSFCGTETPDLTFIDMVIPHHEMAIAASRAVVTSGADPEIVAFAERVITDQQAEIDDLKTIREDLQPNKLNVR